jgi:hypothetical protein
MRLMPGARCVDLARSSWKRQPRSGVLPGAESFKLRGSFEQRTLFGPAVAAGGPFDRFDQLRDANRLEQVIGTAQRFGLCPDKLVA